MVNLIVPKEYVGQDGYADNNQHNGEGDAATEEPDCADDQEEN